MKYYIFSLGNPDDKYAHTRHNAGRIVADEINFDVLENDLAAQLQYFVPDTYMNESGIFVAKKMRNAGEGTQVIIIYDDKDIPLGDVKVSWARSSGRHNGVESVIESLGTREFYRVRVGIGEKVNKEMLLQDYVLSKLTPEEEELLKTTAKEKAIQAIKDIVDGKYK